MNTIVVLIRHTLLDSNSSVFDDSSVSISSVGENIQLRMCKLMLKKGLVPDKIYHSPLLRTTQTAKIIGDFYKTPITSESALGESFDEKNLLKLIPQPFINSTIFFIGHGPSLSRLASFLSSDHNFSGQIARSGALVLKFENSIEAGKAKFVDYYSPDLLMP
jgi:phosphohistidine phosphatase